MNFKNLKFMVEIDLQDFFQNEPPPLEFRFKTTDSAYNF